MGSLEPYTFSKKSVICSKLSIGLEVLSSNNALAGSINSSTDYWSAVILVLLFFEGFSAGLMNIFSEVCSGVGVMISVMFLLEFLFEICLSLGALTSSGDVVFGGSATVFSEVEVSDIISGSSISLVSLLD